MTDLLNRHRYKHYPGEVETDLISTVIFNPKFVATPDFVYTCESCGSVNLSSKCWADPNTDEISDYLSGDEEENFCRDCSKSVNIRSIENSDYFNRN